MKIPGWTFLTLISQIPFWVEAIPNCPLAGAEFPPPQTLSLHPVWQQALANLRAKFDLIDSGGTRDVDGDLDGLSYSIQIFSTNPGGGILAERHRTAPNLLANTTGVKRVDGDTVYRLGSVSKIFTVVAWLAELGDVHWNQPITNFIPELANISAQAASRPFDEVRQTSWEDITIASLASQISGVGRDYGVIGEILQTEDVPEALQNIFPKLPKDQRPPCGAYPVCTREEFFRGLQIMLPSYPPWQTASYSNVGFQLFTYALENITGKAFADILTDRVIRPLGLTNTYYQIAPESIGIVPTNTMDSYWYVGLGDGDASGNMYSSTNDLSTLGRAILSSALLPPALTRRWLQPASFTADPSASVGSPWGIRRIQLDRTAQPHRSVSIYTKAGTFRRYSSFLSLIKEFHLGLSINLAGHAGLSNFGLADTIGAQLLPAYLSAARAEAHLLFAGTYVALDGTNSSLSIATDARKPGLGVEAWTHNSTDFIPLAVQLLAGTPAPPRAPEVRLYFNQLVSATPWRGKRQAWRAVFEDTGATYKGNGLWSTECGNWVGVTGITYGSLPLDEFVFEFDGAGRVVSVTNVALRVTLWKVWPWMVAAGLVGGWDGGGGKA
ncbi:beta-lactamase/transpeptidase-like protein [Ampelomyces quisqualis]|uniref:Beta-lactamase/transpeptidase-like protein n=1 Tax=Ampelomyces quisqualis TaxID=50730 RepID=A0A6A5QBP4_AMPQU|nr:beta-lactamase/transpeptidase-like protein [Ampelomyces quisqualis]